MTREEIVKGLELVLECGYGDRAETFVRAVLDLLRVPTVAEIEAARYYLNDLIVSGRLAYGEVVARALDALAREPGLEEQLASWQRVFDQVVVAKQSVVEQLEALEAKLARVREAWEAWDEYSGASPKPVLDAVAAALADEATS